MTNLTTRHMLPDFIPGLEYYQGYASLTPQPAPSADLSVGSLFFAVHIPEVQQVTVALNYF